MNKHKEHLAKVLRPPRAPDITLSVTESEFFYKGVDYLDHMIKPVLLELALEMINVVNEVASSTNISRIESFLGLYNVYRRALKNFLVNQRTF